MNEAIKEAFSAMRKNQGGPFGAIIVRKEPSKAKLCGGRKTKCFTEKIIARGHNHVLLTKDPTAHAEIVAIRKASKKLNRFDLSDCELYTTCEPCPMCLAAAEWAKIKTIYYGATRFDAALIGFDDKKIYGDIKNAPKSKHVKEIKVNGDAFFEPFIEWAQKKDKKQY